ncbi:MAG: hypothetical protein ACJ72N_06125 [Labedaea sp.]
MGLRRVVVAATVALTVAACGSAPAPQGAGGDGSAPETHSGHVHGSAPPPAVPLRDGERFLEIGLAQPYQPAPPQGGTDEYRCFLIDPKLTAAAYLTGSQFLPQNTEIVHHAILYSITASEVEHARSVDTAASGDGWQCFGGTGLAGGLESFGGGSSGETYIGGWAPGHQEELTAELAGYPVQPGSQIVLQVHYNLLATNGKSGPTDQSSVRLRLMPGTAAVTALHALRLPAPIELPCAPTESGPLCDRSQALRDLVQRTGNQASSMVYGLNTLCNRGSAPTPGPTQQCEIKVRQPVRVFSVAPHMHLLGRSMTVELNPGTPNARKLLDQPAFNFDDQSSQPLPAPVTLNRGDTLRVTCTHDATLRAQLPELKPLQPRYVVWGDGTSDEMCLATLTATAKL